MMGRNRKIQLELVPPPPISTDFYTVGLDLSLTGTGIVVIDPDGDLNLQRTVGYALKEDSSEREIIERQLYIATEITDVIRGLTDAHGARPRIAIEHYAFSKHSSSVTKLAELRGVVKSQIWLVFQLIPDMVTVGEARRTVLGKGVLAKSSVIELLRRRGLTVGDHNIADAYVVAECLRRRASVPKRCTDGKSEAGG